MKFKQFIRAEKHLVIHYSLVLALYLAALVVATQLLAIPAAHRDFITSLSSGAILATFGSAIATIGMLWTGDRAGRIAMNVDILYSDILSVKAWRRWPFLPRSGVRALSDGMIQKYTLTNPSLLLKVGTHSHPIILPTVEQDYFDLPIFSNLVPLLLLRREAHTAIAQDTPAIVFPESHMAPLSQLMAYECLLDIWYSVLIFRASRYVVHFGAALTISSGVLGGTAAWMSGL